MREGQRRQRREQNELGGNVLLDVCLAGTSRDKRRKSWKRGRRSWPLKCSSQTAGVCINAHSWNECCSIVSVCVCICALLHISCVCVCVCVCVCLSSYLLPLCRKCVWKSLWRCPRTPPPCLSPQPKWKKRRMKRCWRRKRRAVATLVDRKST